MPPRLPHCNSRPPHSSAHRAEMFLLHTPAKLIKYFFSFDYFQIIKCCTEFFVSNQDWFINNAISLLIPVISLFLFTIASGSIILIFIYFGGLLRAPIYLDFAAGRTPSGILQFLLLLLHEVSVPLARASTCT